MKTHLDEHWTDAFCSVRAVGPDGYLCYGYFEPEIGPEDLKGGWVLHPKSGYDTSDWKNSMQTKNEYIKRLEKKVDELSKLAEHGNGPVLLGWMDAHSKTMDRLTALEREFRKLQVSYQDLSNRNLELETLLCQ